MRRCGLARLAAALTLLPLTGLLLAAQPGRLRVLPDPLLVIGGNEDDTTQIFAVVAGATRLPNGNILVGDRGNFALQLFAPNGRHLRSLGRKGAGPGEFGYLARFWRCGDSLITWDIDGHRASVFNLDLEFVRFFRFGTPEVGGQVPYASACNAQGTFVHYGWGTGQDPRPPTYRTTAPFWLSRADVEVGPVLGRFPASERLVHESEGRVVGSGPLPLGRESDVAIGRDRVYIGTAESFEILVFGPDGRRLPPLRKADAAERPVTRADIDAVLELALAAARPDRHRAIQAQYASIRYPRTLPPYRALRVDALDQLWVEEYPRPQAAAVTWTVFAPDGRLVGEAALPRHLSVFEIGRDYVLGRYLDPEEAIPQVRMYRLIR
jgi:hypothetical protein